MFSRKQIDSRLLSWTQAALDGSRPARPSLEYHSLIEVDRANSHLNTLIEPWNGVKIPGLTTFYIYGKSGERDDYVATRDRTRHWRQTLAPDEIAWIRNERALCAFDFHYWQSRYAWIKDAADTVLRMNPWPSQEIFLDICAEMQDMQIAILLILLKARQLGLSREISLIILHQILFNPHVNAFVASCTEDKTNLLFDMYDFVLERLPFWMRPSETHRRENKFLEFGNDSSVTLQHGQQATGIARGTTPTRAHISELAEFDEGRVSDLIDSSLLKAMHNAPTNFLALEGTAKGMNNWWNHKWDSAKAGWPKGRSRLRPLFLPWFVGELYPDPGWIQAHPIPDGYSASMAPWAANHAKAAKAYVDKTDYLLRRLGSAWKMSLEQIWFYEVERDEAVKENRLPKFLQEMPANDDEAFQSTNISVFSPEVLVYYRENAATQQAVATYGLIGPPEIVNPRLQPDQLARDDSKPSLIVNASRSTGYPIQFELVPLRPVPLDDGLDKIYLYEKPCAGESYGFGMDTADGIGKDRTVIEGIRKYGLNGPTRQILEYASSACSALDSWPFLLAIGTLFTVPDERGELRQPRMAIECRGQGDLPQNIIRMMGWSNFHPWNDRQIDNRKQALGTYNKIGVYTASWFRDAVLSLLIKTLRDGEIEICSPWFVAEMQSLEGEDMVKKIQAGYGAHDDRIMSLAFVLASLVKFDADYYRSAKIAAYSGRTPVGQAPKPKRYRTWAYGPQERDEMLHGGIYLP